MKKQKLILGIILFVLGIIGILSILTMDIPLPAEVEAELIKTFTPGQIKYLILINPVLMLIGAVIGGVFLYTKVGLKVPIINSIIAKSDEKIDVFQLIKSGVVGGMIAGILLTLVGYLFTPYLPAEFLELGENLKPTLAARFLYGGLTEEIIMRFGLMTLVIWLISKIFKKTSTTVYWIGILVAAVVFAIAHLPIAFQAVGSPSTTLMGYILVGNTIGGVIFGWLYWKRGLEAAFIGHIFAHVVMVLAEPML